MRMPGLTALCLLGIALQAAAGASITGRVAPQEEGNTLRVPPTVSVMLDRGQSGSTLIRRDGTFSLNDVPTGHYVLSFDSKEWLLPSYEITVNSQGAVIARPHRIGEVQTSTLNPVPYPLVVKPSGYPIYKDPIKAFSIGNLLFANPMYLLMAVGGVLVFLMPKLLGSIDPEALKEAQANQADLHAQMGSLQNMDFGSGLAKMLAGGPQQADAGKSSAKPSGSSGGSRKRK